MALSTQPYKGARDFYPEDKRLQKYMFDVIRRTVETFGYEEYDAPILEPTDLFLSKGNEEIIRNQTYTFTDRGERSVTLRTEMTPSVSRMVAARRQELAYPLRWYSIPQCWRYERTQRGRGREFYQLNVDVFGVETIQADLEIVQVADAVLQAFKASRDSYTIKLNSRKLTDYMFQEYLGLSSVEGQALTRLVDRKSKMEPAEFTAQVDAILSPSERKSGRGQKLMPLLAVKSLEDLPEELKAQPAAQNLTKLIQQLKEAGVSNVVFEPSIARGFDYYTDVVFEVFDTNPENNRSMFGGGRYDGLVELFGVPPIPAVGFAMGDITLQNFLESNDLLPKLQTETDLYAVLIGDVLDAAQKPLSQLRQMGVNVATDYTNRKLDKQIKTAVKKDIRYALFIGEEELAGEQFVLKDLKTGQEERHSLQRVVAVVKDYRKT